MSSRERRLPGHLARLSSTGSRTYTSVVVLVAALIAAGLPLVTVRGGAPAARAAESILRAAGLPELVAADHASFVQLAVELGTNSDKLRGVRERLAVNRASAPLFDTPARVRDLEAAFRRMMESVK